MKKQTYISALTFLAVLTACDGSDAPVQRPDGYDFITFSAQTQKLMTRANPYEAYDPERHPLTMGAFGYHDIANSFADPIFNNNTVSYNAATKTWNNDVDKRWTDYQTAKAFDFFAYMPQTAGAKVELSNTNTYTLSFPFSMTAEKSSSEASSSDGVSTPVATPALFNTKNAPIICALPENKLQGDIDHVVKMKFDQTLTAYNLQFMLDPKMGAMRQFRIKSVTISGDIATSCTISRTYQWNGTDWTTGKIQWTDIVRTTFATNEVSIPYKPTDDQTPADVAQASDNETKTVTIGSTAYTPWGDTFYVIPDSKFQPTISVTYDTEFLDQDGKTVVTRKDITSSIVLNKNNFSSLNTGNTATISSIRILIQPRYLYVLADEDAYTGYLLVE